MPHFADMLTVGEQAEFDQFRADFKARLDLLKLMPAMFDNEQDAFAFLVGHSMDAESTTLAALLATAILELNKA